MKKLVIITGPTAAGKTEMSIKLARKFNGEVISADSRQIYKYMDIGTAKVNEEIREEIPHHLIDIREPDEDFTVAEYKKLARKKIKNIQNREKLPLLCGGSQFYIKAAVDGLVFPQVPPDWDFREKKKKEPLENLFEELKEKDPRRAKDIDENNKRRIIRALEIIEKTGKPVPPLKKEELPYKELFLAPEVDFDKLEEKISERTEDMIKRGLEKEAKRLLEIYSQTPQNTIGYKEWISYFKGRGSKEKVIEEIKTNTRQYAKKQMNWLKKEDRIQWIKNFKEAQKLTENYLN